jgi:hypothetical protein
MDKVAEVVATPIEKLLPSDEVSYARTLVTLAAWNPFPSTKEEDIVNMKTHPSYELWSKVHYLGKQLRRCFACKSKHVVECRGDVRFGSGRKALLKYDCGECRKMSWLILDPAMNPPMFGTMDIAGDSHGARFTNATDQLEQMYGDE